MGRALVKLHAALSPDGRLLAVATPSGLQMIDLDKSRINAAASSDKKQAQVEALVLGRTARSPRWTPSVWSDDRTALAQTDRRRRSSPAGPTAPSSRSTLPPDVQPGWTMIPSYGAGK